MTVIPRRSNIQNVLSIRTPLVSGIEHHIIYLQ